MRITNKLNLPEAFVRYADTDYEYKPNRYSVTELLLPVRQIKLTRKYYKELEKDVVDEIPALFGTAVHHILEVNTPKCDYLQTEVPVSCEIDGATLSGRIDLLNTRDLSIEDYKTCSVSKITGQDFDDWKKQGLIYALILFIKTGTIYRRLRFYGLMKDWSKVKAYSNPSYPQSPIYVWQYDIADSDYDYIEKYVRGKLTLLKSDDVPECTDEEKWYTGTVYAVYKKAGDKKASMLCDTEQEAHDYITNKCDGAGEIQVRYGEYLKCKHYCSVCKVCKKGEVEC